MSDYIGLVFCGDELRQIINPDYDAQLDDPAHVAGGADHYMVRVKRSHLPFKSKVFSFPEIYFIQSNAQKLALVTA